MPPGPPVIATLTGEVCGDPGVPYAHIQQAAEEVRARLAEHHRGRRVDTTVEAVQPKLVFELDRQKAALSGISAAGVAATLGAALGGADRRRTPCRAEVNPPRGAPAPVARGPQFRPQTLRAVCEGRNRRAGAAG